ncbi:MAG: NAD(P)H-dependent oxidoreductase [Peptococcaceae bacterium]|nr:NAD(P)H-dependent oxidoreductase [Peptococcaceae bacterium]
MVDGYPFYVFFHFAVLVHAHTCSIGISTRSIKRLILNVPLVTPADIVQADAIIFCTPTRFGNVAAQMKQFLDTTGGIWFQGKTANKVVSAMTSAQNSHGGQEMTILSLYTTMYHWGAIVVAPGCCDIRYPVPALLKLLPS